MIDMEQESYYDYMLRKTREEREMISESQQIKMKLKKAMDRLPAAELSTKVVSVLSGTLDSTIMTMMLMKKYGRTKVIALSYDHGQNQNAELEKAAAFCETVGIEHRILDVSVLGKIVSPMPTNIGTSINMSNAEEDLNGPRSKEYVAFSNMILLSMSLSFAESVRAEYVCTELQVYDENGYWDTSKKFIQSINAVAEQNRHHKVKVLTPFSHLSKASKLELCKELNMVHLLDNTFTCSSVDTFERSCARCSPCTERINAFMKVKLADPIEYQIDIPWRVEEDVS